MTTITREQLHERARRKVKELEFAITQSAFTSIRDGLNEELELARIALASMEANPVSQTYELPELIEGMEVSVDVSTCDFDAGHRYFGTVTEVSELDSAKNGYILLVQDAKPNFDVNGNSPVIPCGWISCSERMPEDEQEVIVHNKLGYRYVSYFDEHSGLFFDMRGGNQMNCIEHILVTHWRPMPAAPKPEQS